MNREDKHSTKIFFEGVLVDGQHTTDPSIITSDETHRPDNYVSALSKGKRRETSGHDLPEKSLKGPPKKLVLPNIVEEGGSVAQSLVLRDGSPWDALTPIFTCDLAGSVSIAVHRTRPSRVFAVRAYPERSGDKIMKILQKVQHPNVISTKDIYKHGEVLYSVGVDRPLTLDNLVACDRFPSELQLASILAQVRLCRSTLASNR